MASQQFLVKSKQFSVFSLIIYCALLEDALPMPDFSRQMLNLCIILSLSSIVFKLIPNRFYADILSLLNLFCGIAGIVLVLDGRYAYATLAILAGQIFDLFDGRMAEKARGYTFRTLAGRYRRSGQLWYLSGIANYSQRGYETLFCDAGYSVYAGHWFPVMGDTLQLIKNDQQLQTRPSLTVSPARQGQWEHWVPAFSVLGRGRSSW